MPRQGEVLLYVRVSQGLQRLVLSWEPILQRLERTPPTTAKTSVTMRLQTLVEAGSFPWTSAPIHVCISHQSTLNTAQFLLFFFNGVTVASQRK